MIIYNLQTHRLPIDLRNTRVVSSLMFQKTICKISNNGKDNLITIRTANCMCSSFVRLFVRQIDIESDNSFYREIAHCKSR